MKASRVVVVLLLLVFLSVSWLGYIKKTVKQRNIITDYITKAEESVDAGLYQQGIEFYHKADNAKSRKEYHTRIKEIYDLFYEEESSNGVRTMYINDMLLAVEKFPKDPYFWDMAIRMQLEGEDYRDAYNTTIKARNRGAKSEDINEYYYQLRYMERADYKIYNKVLTTLNGYNSVSTGSMWTVIDDKGEEITKSYPYIGLINDNGYGIYEDEGEMRLLDKKRIPRARYNGLNIAFAGYYSEPSDYTPIMVGERDFDNFDEIINSKKGEWIYIDKHGNRLPETYEFAGSFINGKAAVIKNGKWEIIDTEGKTTEAPDFSDIKLDLKGSFIQGNVIIAKESSKYRLYNEKFKPIGDFECDDIDICINNGLIAFKSGGKWGFVDVKGKVAIEPQYFGARSFSGKYAAVCNEDGLWGFINKNQRLVVDYKYLWVHYFNSNETCFISKSENTYQLMRFLFD